MKFQVRFLAFEAYNGDIDRSTLSMTSRIENPILQSAET